MMENIRGAFLFDGEWIPNQFTTLGWKSLLARAFQAVADPWEVGLCETNPADLLIPAAINEPSATNGYARTVLDHTVVNWPTISDINGEVYVESKNITFTATGAYSTSSNRFFLCNAGKTKIYAVSSAFPTGPRIVNVTFITKYRLYFR